jgi:hypothetical protein
VIRCLLVRRLLLLHGGHGGHRRRMVVLWHGGHHQGTFPNVFHNLPAVRSTGGTLSRCVGALLSLRPLSNQCCLGQDLVLLS